MSILFMRDNHTFISLEGLPVDEAIELIRQASEAEGGYGFVGCKGEHGSEIFQWRPGEPWEDKVRTILNRRGKG